MVEQFAGKWKLVLSENFDDYMKELGEFFLVFLCTWHQVGCVFLIVMDSLKLPDDTAELRINVYAGVNSATRYIGNMMKPKFIISVGEDGVISMKTQSALKSVEIKFKLDEEFEEKTADDRLTKVRFACPPPHVVNDICFNVSGGPLHLQTIITLNDGKLVQKQTWEGKTTTLERTLQGGKLITVRPKSDF